METTVKSNPLKCAKAGFNCTLFCCAIPVFQSPWQNRAMLPMFHPPVCLFLYQLSMLILDAYPPARVTKARIFTILISGCFLNTSGPSCVLSCATTQVLHY